MRPLILQPHAVPECCVVEMATKDRLVNSLTLLPAHTAGLVHRGLKPADIFAARTGRRGDIDKLLDFRLVKHLDRRAAGSAVQDMEAGEDSGRDSFRTHVDEIRGTPQYRAPE